MIRYPYALKQGIEIKHHYDYPLPQMSCYPNELIQVSALLIHNALSVMETQEQLTIQWDAYIEYLIVSVTDSQLGHTEDIKIYIFQLFFAKKT